MPDTLYVKTPAFGLASADSFLGFPNPSQIATIDGDVEVFVYRLVERASITAEVVVSPKIK